MNRVYTNYLAKVLSFTNVTRKYCRGNRVNSQIKSIQDKLIKSELLANLGTTYFFAQDYPNAEKKIRLALEINPDLIMANYLMAEILEKNNQSQKALIYWQECLSQEPNQLLNRSPLLIYA